MESFVPEETPLAAFLEGEGTADDSFNLIKEGAQLPSPPDSPAFAPRALSNPRSRPLKRFAQPLSLRIPEKSAIGKAHTAWSRAVNSRIGRAENAQFLEHFRYIVVASQLLDEYPDLGSLQTSKLQDQAATPSSSGCDVNNAAINMTGVLATAGIAFVIVLLVHWARGMRFSKSSILLALACTAVAGILFYAHVRRQWLKYLRNQAVESASDLTTNIRGFELTSAAALSLIQEVELVSKGYRLSTPLPPISRFEDVKANRKCARLRKCLQRSYASVLPAFREANAALGALLKEDDLEKYLDVYDIPQHAIQEAINPDLAPLEEDDSESLKSLRVVSYQYTTLRRVVLCSLMSLEADGGKPDFPRWLAASEIMKSLSLATATWAEKLNELLRETEQFSIPTTPRLAPKPTNERLRGQVRKITNLSSGIRSLQAKMVLLREESNKKIEQSEDLADLGPTLLAQYESIGADLKMLMAAWETGKASLATNLDKQERRISLASSGLRSPVSSLGGLTAVEEGGPDDALRALTGQSKSNRSSLAVSGSDEEVFEGLSIPRQRNSMTREERIARMYEERQRQADNREKRESSTNMMRELQSVMNLRPKRHTIDRITSI
ncbi:hypothetical protein MBLNU459_g2182t1 [Dothideomycetes sp. NU459]